MSKEFRGKARLKPQPKGDMAQKRMPPAPEENNEDQDLIWGVHPVLEMLKTLPRRVEEVVVRQSRSGPGIQEIIQLSRQNNVKLRFDAAPETTGAQSRMCHQGVRARISPQPNLSLDELLAQIQADDSSLPPLLLALDNIQDPQNLGAIIRTAAAAGVQGVILPKDRSAPLSGVAVKASAGGLAHVAVCRVTNLTAALLRLQEEGFWIFGTDKAAGSSVYQTDFSGRVCLVIGNEGKGMRPLVKKQCDHLVSIPMYSPLDSLNAAAATAIILFEVRRRSGG